MATESPRGRSTAELEAAVTLSELRQVLATLEATDGRGAMVDGRVSARDVEALCSSIIACKRTTRDCAGQQRSSHDKSLASTRRRCMPCMLGLSRGVAALVLLVVALSALAPDTLLREGGSGRPSLQIMPRTVPGGEAEHHPADHDVLALTYDEDRMMADDLLSRGAPSLPPAVNLAQRHRRNLQSSPATCTSPCILPAQCTSPAAPAAAPAAPAAAPAAAGSNSSQAGLQPSPSPSPSPLPSPSPSPAAEVVLPGGDSVSMKTSGGLGSNPWVMLAVIGGAPVIICILSIYCYFGSGGKVHPFS